MAWIRMIREDEATGPLKMHYARYGSDREGVDHILRIHSLNPDSLKYHYDLYKHLMTGPSGLSRAQREMIGTVTSKINGCHY